MLRNFLFVSPTDPARFGIDLASLNIQRGRDHGLPDYNTVRKFYTGRGNNHFSQITSDTAQANTLKKLYGDVNNIDLWIGILSEDHLSGTSVGLTMQQILKAQFAHLRDGMTYYFYLSDPYLPITTRNTISKTRFADVIKRNTTLTNLQDNVFFTSECPGDEEEEAVTTDSVTSNILKSPITDTRVFPNPSSGNLHVDFGSMTGTVSVRIFNTNNKLVKVQTATANAAGLDMNLSDLPAGVYILSMSSGADMKTLKLIKTGN